LRNVHVESLYQLPAAIIYTQVSATAFA
jgi:hypothetical protein